jgi:hypothetical protein
VPGNVHKFLVRELVVAAQRWGYEVLAADAKYYLLDGATIHLPPKLLRHQPDIVAARKAPPHLLIGEAKTGPDLKSKRSKEQLADFASIPGALVAITYPERSESILRGVIEDLGIQPGDMFRCIPVPEELFPDD